MIKYKIMKILKVLLICFVVLFAGCVYSQTVTQTAQEDIQNTTCPFEKVVGLSKSNQSGKSGYVFLLQFILGLDQEVYPDRYMTGYFGDLTTAALKRYQSKNGISQSGIVDQSTVVKFCEEYSSQGCIFSSSEMFLMAKGATTPKYYIHTLQSLLDYLGYYSGEPNGSFGATTEEALVKFQTAAKLYPTKIIDADTRTALCAVWNKLIDYSKSFSTASTTVTTKKPTTTYAPSNYISSPLSAYCFAFPNKSNVGSPVYFYALAVGGKYPYAYN
ncbi:MAG: peptidoglycan-binding domain-containing protein [Candidatus Pacebacteria bacterium]|nr:peptidoglycan-binding domain-containing protein [Candidatus Paceibacterota bacterium]